MILFKDQWTDVLKWWVPFLAFINSLLTYCSTKELTSFLRIKMSQIFFSIFEKLRFFPFISYFFKFMSVLGNLESTVKNSKIKLTLHASFSLPLSLTLFSPSISLSLSVFRGCQIKSENYPNLQQVTSNSVRYNNNVILYIHIFFPVLCL